MAIEILKKIWPEWTLGKRIGGGAYGVVYEAIRNEYGVENHAAIKIISIPASEAEVDYLLSEGMDMAATRTHLQTIVQDFVNEIRLMLSLEGRPNVVNVKDYKVVEKKGELGWYIFILMELLIPFSVYTCDKKLSEREVIKLGYDICTALETCAEENIIHRDIKPGNILVHKNGTFKLGDFGIARKLENMAGGLSQRYTPKYMAPEVATSRYYDGRVDIYSLGIVLYELLNEKCIPFQPNKQINYFADIEQAVNRRNSGEAIPAPSEASPAMANLILRACAYDPDMRFSSAAEMKRALVSVANGTYQTTDMYSLDRTTSVRKTSANYDKTTAVRKVPAELHHEHANSVNTFGVAPKKKSKFPAIIAVFMAAIILGAGVYAVPKLINFNNKDDSSIIVDQTVIDSAQHSDNTLGTDNLSDLFLIDSKYYEYKDIQFTDSFGNTYNGVHLYNDLFNEMSYSTYNLNGKYSTFSGSIVATEATNPDWEYYASIFVDGNLAFSKTGITKTTGKIDFIVDVTNGQTLEIRMGADVPYGGYNEELGLVNATLSAESIYPTQEVPDMIETQSVNTEVSLNKLVLIDSKHYEYIDREFIDSYGNSYYGAHYYTDLFNSLNEGQIPHSTHNLKGQYSVFSGSIVSTETTNPDWNYYINIYVDDVLAFSKTGYSKSTGKLDFEINVTGGQILKITMGVEGAWGDYNEELALVNCILT